MNWLDVLIGSCLQRQSVIVQFLGLAGEAVRCEGQVGAHLVAFTPGALHHIPAVKLLHQQVSQKKKKKK